MRKFMKEKRKKFTVNTYLREAINYETVIVKEDDVFYTIKKFHELTEIFIPNQDDGFKEVYIAPGYYMFEITPLKEHYNLRFYYDDKKRLIDYYIDMTLENGIENHVPYYIDLFLDITHNPRKDTIRFADEDELQDALEKHYISKKDYDCAYRTGNKIKKEITNHTNPYMNLDKIKIINRYFRDEE